MDTNPSMTEHDYEAALRKIEGLMAAAAGTPEGEQLVALVELVEAYERANFQWPTNCPELSEAQWKTHRAHETQCAVIELLSSAFRQDPPADQGRN